jgi:hypothetical protein
VNICENQLYYGTGGRHCSTWDVSDLRILDQTGSGPYSEVYIVYLEDRSHDVLRVRDNKVGLLSTTYQLELLLVKSKLVILVTEIQNND